MELYLETCQLDPDQDPRFLPTGSEPMHFSRQESMELYLEACQIDPELVPFTAKGPTLTPPIKD